MNSTRIFAAVALVNLSVTWSVVAQNRVIETAPSSGGTNSFGSSGPAEYRGGSFLDRLAKPGSLPSALGDGPVFVPSAPGQKLDPATQKRLQAEQDRRKNWAIENAARINRGDDPTERRNRLDDGRTTSPGSRAPTGAELRLQAVDPEFAREFRRQQNFNNPGKRSESGPDSGRDRSDRDRAENAAGDRDAQNQAGDPDDPAARSGKGTRDDEAPRAPGENPLLTRAVSGGVKETAAENALRQVNGGQDLGLPKSDPRNVELEALRQNRQQELDSFLGGTKTESLAAGGDALSGGGLGRRAVDFQQLIGGGSEAAVTAPRLGSEPAPGLGGGNVLVTPISTSLGSGPTRELGNLGLGSAAASLNLNPTPTAPVSAPPLRLAPRPSVLSIPIRGQGGF